MGRTTWINDDGIKKGEWTSEEDRKLVAYIKEHGLGDWRVMPMRAGLQRCGKSCRLRWLNYLRPGIKKGKFTPQEEEQIIKLHSLLGNRWASIAKQMQSRTDNDIKNHWNSCLKRRLAKNGIDPMTHEPVSTVYVTNSSSSSSSSSSTSSSSPILSPSSSSFSTSLGSARLLNKLAASNKHGLDMIIKNVILSEPNISNVQAVDVEMKIEEKMTNELPCESTTTPPTPTTSFVALDELSPIDPYGLGQCDFNETELYDMFLL